MAPLVACISSNVNSFQVAKGSLMGLVMKSVSLVHRSKSSSAERFKEKSSSRSSKADIVTGKMSYKISGMSVYTFEIVSRVLFLDLTMIRES